MNLKKAVSPRKTLKARLYSKKSQIEVCYPMGEWIILFNLLFYFVSFVIFVDQPEILG